MSIFATSNGILYSNLATLKGAVKLEAKGLHHSSGRSARKHACQLLGLRLRTPYEAVVKALANRMQELLLLEAQNGSRNDTHA